MVEAMNDTRKDEPRPILYGVSDYAEIRKANAWFVDRTAKLRDLEKVRYALFLRPRRFGKSLFCAILEAYYDIDCAHRFDELFSGTAIGANPTEQRNSHLVLYFNFSAVKKEVGEVEPSFELHVADRIDDFARKYAKRIPDGLSGEILARKTAAEKMSALFGGMKGRNPGIFCIIDEYDNFTNTILAESGLGAYNDLCHGDGFFKQFFTELKTLTTSLDAPLKRLFVTGVSPVTMDDVTSGFNIGTNISLRSQFADLTGFGHDDIRAMAQYYAPLCGFDAANAEQVCLDWFDNYRFGSFDAPPVANTTLVLNFFEQLVNGGRWPDDYIDENLRTDYAKIRHLLINPSFSGRIRPFFDRMRFTGKISSRLSSGNADIRDPFDFVKWFYHEGLLTIEGCKYGRYDFSVPNRFASTIIEEIGNDRE